MIVKKFLIILLIIFCHNTNAESKHIKNLEASYIFYYKNTQAGTMTLKIQTENSKIRISTLYDGNFLAELANRGYREETAYVEIKENTIYPLKYIYKDTNESYEAIFKNNTVEIISDKKIKKVINYNEIIYDPISLLILLMRDYPNLDIKYNVLSKKNLKIYDYIFKKNISIRIKELDYNGFSAEYRSGNKTNIIFFSKNHKNLMVSTRIMKKGKEKIRIELSKIKILN